jgi:Concanavalin A-like lectin/glucanases superfamily
VKNVLFLIIFLFSGTFLHSQNINKGLVGYWPMDGNLLDSTGLGGDGIIFGDVTSTTFGKRNQAQIFDGDGDYIELPEGRRLDYVNPEAFSWTLWFNITEDLERKKGFSQSLITFNDPDPVGDIFMGFGAIERWGDEITFFADGKGGIGESGIILSWKPGDGFEAGKWYHAAGIRDYENDRILLYVDGVPVDSSVCTFSPFEQSYEMNIGVFRDSDEFVNYFSGGIDEVKIYDRALTPQEVLIIATARDEQLSTDTNQIKIENIKCKSDSLLSIKIKNEGPSQFVISNSEMTRGDVFLVQNSGSFSLEDQEELTLNILFDPKGESGTFSDTLFVRNNLAVQPLVIYLSGEKDVQIIVTEKIDFGETVTCFDDLSSSGSFSVENINIDEDLMIQDFIFSNTFFSLQNGSNSISFGQTEIYEILFSPSELGDFSETLTIRFENCDISRKIELNGKLTELKKEFDEEINFGGVENGEKVISSHTFLNSGTTDIKIDYVQNNSPEYIFSTSFNLGNVLFSGDYFEYEIEFLPSGGEHIDTLFIGSESLCGTEQDEIILSGEGRFRALFDLKIGDVEAETAQKINLKLELTNSENLVLSRLDSFEIDFAFARDILAPTDLIPVSEQNSSATFTKIIKPEMNAENQSFVLGECTVALGTKERDNISITAFRAFDRLASPELLDGEIFVTNIYDYGDGKRLFYSKEWLSLGTSIPNPAGEKTSLSFSLSEDGRTKLYLMNSFGNVAKILFDENMSEGNYHKEFSIEGLASGVYYFILETPSQRKIGKLIKQ